MLLKNGNLFQLMVNLKRFEHQKTNKSASRLKYEIPSRERVHISPSEKANDLPKHLGKTDLSFQGGYLVLYVHIYVSYLQGLWGRCTYCIILLCVWCIDPYSVISVEFRTKQLHDVNVKMSLWACRSGRVEECVQFAPFKENRVGWFQPIYNIAVKLDHFPIVGGENQQKTHEYHHLGFQ